MWEVKLGVQSNECFEAVKSSWGETQESIVGDGEARS